MTDQKPNCYVITEEQLRKIRTMIFHEDEVTFEKLTWKILCNPLPDHDAEIRKDERERINNELDYIKHIETLQEFFVTVRLCDVRKIVRGEP